MIKKKTYKYQDIAFEIEKRISSGVYPLDAPLPPEKLLSNEFGVNHLTCRRAMDLLVQNGRITRRRGSGTFIVELSKNENKQKGFTILYAGDTESDFFRELYIAIVGESQKAEYKIFHCNPKTAKIKELRKNIAECSAIICDKTMIDLINNGKISIVGKNIISLDLYYQGNENIPSYAICCDVLQATKIATEYLIDNGHENIAFISSGNKWNKEKNYMQPSKNRRSYLGFHTAFISRNLVPKTDSSMGLIGENPEEHVHSIIQWLKSLNSFPSAFVCEGDFIAAALIRASAKLEKQTPKDFSVIGTGNTKWCKMLNPTLSSVYMGEKEMAELAIALIHKPPPKERHLFKTEPKLIIREST